MEMYPENINGNASFLNQSLLKNRQPVTRSKLKSRQSSFNFDSKSSSYQRPWLKNFLCWLLAFSGCFAQIFQISRQYFKYGTVTQLSIARPTLVSPPSVILCFEADCVAGPTMAAMRAVFGEDSLGSITAEKWLNAIPPTEDLFTQCITRRPSSFDYDSGCSKLNLGRLSKQRRVCYSIRSLNYSYAYEKLTNGLSDPKFYNITFEGSMVRGCKHFYIFLKASNNEFRGSSASYINYYRGASEVVKPANESLTAGDAETEQAEKNAVTLSYARYISQLLPEPYRTQCINYRTQGFESNDQCYELCLTNKSIEATNRIPFSIMSSLEYPPVNFELLSRRDLEDPDLVNKLRRAEIFCKRKCSRPSCYSEDFVPKVLSSEPSANPVVSLFASNEPEIRTEFKPLISIVDFVSFCLSCTGFWLGFCPYGFLRDLDIFGKLAAARNLVRRKSVGVQKKEKLFQSKDFRKLAGEIRLINANLGVIWSELAKFRKENQSIRQGASS